MVHHPQKVIPVALTIFLKGVIPLTIVLKWVIVSPFVL
ncbi:hypothetical protein Hamer_G005105 [Homarus americanus]|uniref:Uncharacterized protein n=1 Tax=Homarus americanus TaxID=6706 RepID=A0A8J5MUC3_HOMAM|nr:hypothetical protein Hamer_G005105 [Homarus americanus]